MLPWKGAGSVIAGTVATVVTTGVTIVLLPVLGLVTGEVVGTWLPIWVFAVPVAIGPVLGGAIAGYLHGDTPRRAAVLGSVAVALGLAVFGVVASLLALLLMLNMTPAYGQVDVSRAASSMMVLGGAVGLVTGAVVGALGGGRRVSRPSGTPGLIAPTDHLVPRRAAAASVDGERYAMSSASGYWPPSSGQFGSIPAIDGHSQYP